LIFDVLSFFFLLLLVLKSKCCSHRCESIVARRNTLHTVLFSEELKREIESRPLELVPVHSSVD
jgi:hypothetical protein